MPNKQVKKTQKGGNKSKQSKTLKGGNKLKQVKKTQKGGGWGNSTPYVKK